MVFKQKAIRLHINILTVFAVLIAIIVLAIVAYGYQKSARSAVLSAEMLLKKSGSSVVERTGNIFNTAFMALGTYASFGDSAEKPTIHSHPLQPVLIKFLRQHRDFTAAFIGFDDGDFFLIASLEGRPALRKSLGQTDSAAWYTQFIGHRDDGTRFEFKRYYSTEMVPLDSSATLSPAYDPRARSWFIPAGSPELTQLSEVYTYALSGEPGITVSRRFEGANSGVIGLDLSMMNLSNFLKRQLISPGSEIMIFNEDGEVYAFSNPERMPAAANFSGHPSARSSLNSLNSPVMVALMDNFWAPDRDDRSRVTLKAGSRTYLAHVSALPNLYGRELFVGVAVPEQFFLGPFMAISTQTLLVSLVMLVLFIPLVYYASRRIAHPLNDLTESVERIKKFELDDPIEVRSNILEIQNLAKATETMRAALRAFSRYIPKALVESMIVRDVTPELGGKREQLTFMFTDIQDFTSISEKLSAEEVTGNITRYLRLMSRVIINHRGTVDKYIGDAIMAFWNAPVPDESHAQDACLAALECQRKLAVYQKTCLKKKWPVFNTRMGIHTGEAVVGNIGSADRMDYTAMGSAVNLASRLEGLNKYLGTNLLVSLEASKLAGDNFVFRYAGKVVPKGTTTPIPVFELLGTRPGSRGMLADYSLPESAMKKVVDWNMIVGLYLAREFEQAVSFMDVYLEKHGSDSLVETYRRLAMEYSRNPPGPDWTGEQTYKTK